MLDIHRDSPIGGIMRFISRGRLAKWHDKDSQSGFPNGALGTGTSEKSKSMPTDMKLVAWYGDGDPDNPLNWSLTKKLWVSLVLFFYSFAGYIGSSLYAASAPDISQLFKTSDVVTGLGFAIYILGYGIGPLLFSPLSEIPAVGRNWTYLISFSLFVILCVPMSLVENFAGILVLRFLLGFFCSPCLATVGASYSDMFGPIELPYVIAIWGGGTTLAPALGPLVGGFAVQAMDWHWSSWELLWLSAPILLVMFFALPETSAENILLRRAQRLRKLTSRDDLRSESEIRQSEIRPLHVLYDTLIKPLEINALDPAILFSTFYLGLNYGTFYSFFESFPLVYGDIYGFGLVKIGLCYLSVLVGFILAIPSLCAYFYFVAPKRRARMRAITPEECLYPGLYGTFLIPIGLFLFAWTARPSVHWSVSLVGVAITLAGTLVITQVICVYLPFSYPRYAGSLFAANGLARSVFAAAAVLFSPPMFRALGINGGVSLLAGVSILCSGGLFVLFYFGANLRKRRRFTSG